MKWVSIDTPPKHGRPVLVTDQIGIDMAVYRGHMCDWIRAHPISYPMPDGPSHWAEMRDVVMKLFSKIDSGMLVDDQGNEFLSILRGDARYPYTPSESPSISYPSDMRAVVGLIEVGVSRCGEARTYEVSLYDEHTHRISLNFSMTTWLIIMGKIFDAARRGDLKE